MQAKGADYSRGLTRHSHCLARLHGRCASGSLITLIEQRWQAAVSRSLCSCLADLGDLLDQLIVKIFGSTTDDPVANQIYRRASYPQLIRELMRLIKRSLDIGALHVPFELRNVEPDLVCDAQHFFLVGLAGLAEVASGASRNTYPAWPRRERPWLPPFDSSPKIGSSLKTTFTLSSSSISFTTSGMARRQKPQL